MRRISLVVVLALLCAVEAGAQFKQGQVELSLSGSAGSVTTSRTMDGTTTSHSTNMALVDFAPSIYLVDGLSVDLRFGGTFIEHVLPSYSIIGGFGYTGLLEGGTAAPFLHAGYGVTNSLPLLVLSGPQYQLLDIEENRMKVKILDLGAGVKVLVSEKAFLRMEINYRRYSYTQTYWSWSHSTEYAYSSVGVFLGFGVVL